MRLTRFIGIALLAGLLAAPCANGQDKPAATKPAAEQPAQPAPPKAEAPMVYVLMKTSKGDMTIELNQEKAPVSTANFLSYVDKKFYDGTIFHRVMANFMIQGGGMEPSGAEKKPTDKPIKNEWKNGLKNAKFTIAMARKGGPTGPDSATCQFFINTVDNPGLDRPDGAGAAYAVFGKVVAGFETVEKIKNTPVVADARDEVSKPTEIIKIESVRRLTPEEVAALKGKP